ncbi:MAG: LYR motif-containing protein 4 [Caeruleum heppii]|nr:MAG: LYR motif-containing protein 4 [Caeruleum heppii]
MSSQMSSEDVETDDDGEQYRPTGQARRQNRGHVDHDEMEGLPVKCWRRAPTVCNVEPREFSSYRRKLLRRHHMPRDAHLLGPMSQALLRAARAGRVNSTSVTKSEIKAPVDEELEGKRPDIKEFQAIKWQAIPLDEEGPEPQYLAKRRKGLPPLFKPGVLGPKPGAGVVKRATVRISDGEGNTRLEEMLVTEGQKIEGEIINEVTMTDAGAPGTVVEGVGIVNAEGAVVASGPMQATPPKRRPPPPRRKPKGPGRGRKKKVQFSPGDGTQQASGAAEGATMMQNGEDGAPHANGDIEMTDAMGHARANVDTDPNGPVEDGDTENRDDDDDEEEDDDEDEEDEEEDAEADADADVDANEADAEGEDDREDGELSGSASPEPMSSPSKAPAAPARTASPSRTIAVPRPLPEAPAQRARPVVAPPRPGPITLPTPPRAAPAVPLPTVPKPGPARIHHPLPPKPVVTMPVAEYRSPSPEGMPTSAGLVSPTKSFVRGRQVSLTDAKVLTPSKGLGHEDRRAVYEPNERQGLFENVLGRGRGMDSSVPAATGGPSHGTTETEQASTEARLMAREASDDTDPYSPPPPAEPWVPTEATATTTSAPSSMSVTQVSSASVGHPSTRDGDGAKTKEGVSTMAGEEDDGEDSGPDLLDSLERHLNGQRRGSQAH